MRGHDTAGPSGYISDSLLMLHSHYDPDGVRSARRTPKPTSVVRTGLVAAALVLLVAVIPFGPEAGAQAGSERSQREDVRRQRAAAAAEVDALASDNATLEAAVAELTANVVAQEARVSDARRATAEARAEADRLTGEAEATEAEVTSLEQLLRDRAVQSYIGQTGGSGVAGDALLDATDPTDLELRRVLIETVHGSDRNAIDQLALTREILQRQRDQIAEAVAQAESLEAETSARLEELAAGRAEQQRLQEALQARINGFQAEVAALAAEEDALTAIIAQAEAQAAAAAAAAAAASSQGSSGGNIPPGAASSVNRPASASGLIWPTSGPVTSGYGMRWGSMHAGIDIAPPYGTPVYAANSGTVIFAGGQGGYGNLVLVNHGGGFVTAYAHLSGFATGSGASVGRGQLIGYIGSTGDSTGPHLHFETRVGGSAQNPLNYLP